MANPDRTTGQPSSASPEIDEGVSLSHREPTPEEIAVEAYWIYVAHGTRDGSDVDDWLEAERRLRSRASDRRTETAQRARAGRREEPAET